MVCQWHALSRALAEPLRRRLSQVCGYSVAIIGLATPNFWLAIMLLIYPTIWWGWTPPLEYIPFTAVAVGKGVPVRAAQHRLDHPPYTILAQLVRQVVQVRHPVHDQVLAHGSASPRATSAPTRARTSGQMSSRKPSSSVARACDASLTSTVRIARCTSSRAVRAVSTVT